ncbi:MAG: DUF881 domain-containing protein, partial [Actinomycetota bacterium]|nr:DUF881 domain-containing protein [Actinomycetota bacterium]
LGALTVGFLLAAALSASRAAAIAENARRAELVDLVRERQERAEALADELERLRTRVMAAESAAAAGVPTLQPELAQMELAAGLTALRGPGVTVTLRDASGDCPTGRSEDCRIQDVDLQLAVNTLFGVGAEAVAVNDERLIATTAIRSAGGSVLVNYRVLTSPYVIEAIGEPRRLREGFLRSQLGEDFAVWRDVYGLGYAVQEADDLTVPAFAGSIGLRTATAAGATAGRRQ